MEQRGVMFTEEYYFSNLLYSPEGPKKSFQKKTESCELLFHLKPLVVHETSNVYSFRYICAQSLKLSLVEFIILRTRLLRWKQVSISISGNLFIFEPNIIMDKTYKAL